MNAKDEVKKKLASGNPKLMNDIKNQLRGAFGDFFVLQRNSISGDMDLFLRNVSDELEREVTLMVEGYRRGFRKALGK